MIDDYAERLPAEWFEHGGVMFPMYQAEAMWINCFFDYIPDRHTSYPFALKVAAGKINAVTGESWSNGVHADPQDYMVIPEQPWLDGFCVEKGIIRQFVAMPLGGGYSAEEQITGEATHGGLQIMAFPMKREVFDARFPVRPIEFVREADTMYDMAVCCSVADPSMGLAPGGRMRQEIYEDPFELSDWDTRAFSRCFVHIANSQVWAAITGTLPPTKAPTARDYSRAGLPWFEYYDENAQALSGSDVLGRLQSVLQMGKEKRIAPLPENAPAEPEVIIQYRKGLKRDQVREGVF